MMMDQYKSPSLPLASQMTPRRHRDMRDVSMTSPGRTALPPANENEPLGKLLGPRRSSNLLMTTR